MRVLISSHASMFPPEHGGAKNVRHVAELLSEGGAECRVLAKLHPPVPTRQRFAGQHMDGLTAHREQFSAWDAGQCTWSHAGVHYRGVAGESADLARASEKEVAAFKPDIFILCDDSLDEGLDLFEVAAASGKLVFLAQTIHSLAFGPYAMKPSPGVTACIKKAQKIIAPSQYVKNYIQTHLGREATVFYPDVFGKPPFPELGRYSNPYITMINPCPWKGSSILMGLARRRPDLAFATVPTWGATPDLVTELKAIKNITLLEETPRIDEIFRQTRVLIAPSMCQEAFGLVSPEALLRGVPVVASDIAGLRESTLGVATLIQVLPLPFDGPKEGTDHTKFVWTEPENDIEPWSRALDEILASEENYNQRSRRGREAALAFVKGLSERSVLALFQ
jgi:hypothetical protein